MSFFELDFNKIKLNEILDFCEIRPNNSALFEILNSTLNYALALSQRIWEIPPTDEFKRFTIHDLRHSKKLFFSFVEISKIISFSPYEKIIYFIMVILHDIGMQFPVWDQLGLTPAELSLLARHQTSVDYVRANHGRIGLDLLLRICKGEMSNICSEIDLTRLSKDQLRDISLLAFAHQDEKILNFIISPDNIENFRNQSKYFNQTYRPLLLFYIMSLCDLLDDDQERIPDHDSIDTWGIPETNRVYWFGCYHIIGHEFIPNETGKWNILYKWISHPKDKNTVCNFLNHQYVSRMNRHLQFCKDMFAQFHEGILIPFDQAKLNENNQISSFPDSEKIIEKMETMTQKISGDNDFDVRRIKPLHKPIVYAQGFSEEILPSYNEHFTSEKLKQELIEWLEENMISGRPYNAHFKLLTGEHTDIYIESRLLLLNPILMNEIAFSIYKEFEKKNINCIMGVGTTAIQLSPVLSVLLGNIKSTYTFSKEKKYLPHEFEATLFENANILMIDDILAGGIVLNQILNKLSIKIANVYYYSIFRLGNIQFIPTTKTNIGNVECDALTHYKNILYFPDDENQCDLCKKGLALINESDIYKTLSLS